MSLLLALAPLRAPGAESRLARVWLALGVYGRIAVIMLGMAKVALIDPFTDGSALVARPDTIHFGVLVIVLLSASVGVSALGSGLSLRRFLRV